MKRRGQSAAFLKALRKKHGLGEFKKRERGESKRNSRSRKSFKSRKIPQKITKEKGSFFGLW